MYSRQRLCELCSKPSSSHHKNPRFCSRDCFNAWRRRAPLSDRLDAKTDRSGGDGACWLWRGRRDAEGYGVLWFRGKHRLAHRLAWENETKHAAGELHVLHRCDNPPCVNPAHLSLGTHLDNMRDMYAKGRRRSLRGSDNPSSKLNEKDVPVIRFMLAAGRTHLEVAVVFGVTETCIAQIARGQTWKHVP